MSKLLRCYVANYGLNDSWYDGVLLDFCSNDKPVHSIINLDNGGGKTTLLSFLFSVIDPRKDYFLKSRQDANHKVSDYFSKNGIPGTCILEWSAPSTSNPCRVYVTGRSVYLRPNQELHDVMFCYFKESACAIEEFPGPNLGDNEPAMHWDAIQAWLAVRKKEQGFFQNSVQTNWFERLRADGIVDGAMIRTQMKFSETEGGVDSFVAFKTQEEFLKKFIELASSDDILDKVHRGVVEFKTKAKNLPQLKKCNNELLEAIDLLGQLKIQNNAWENQETQVAQAVQALISLHKNIHGHFVQVNASFAQASEEMELWKKTFGDAKISLLEAEKAQRYTAAVLAFATYRCNDAQWKAHVQSIAIDESRVKHMEFLLLANVIAEHVARRQTLETEIASILHVQAPLKNRLAVSSTAFHRSLQHALAAQKKSQVQETAHQTNHLSRVKANKARVLEATTKIAKQTVKQSETLRQLEAVLSKQKEMETRFNTPIDELETFVQASIHTLQHEQERLSQALQSAQAQKYETTNAIHDEARNLATIQSNLEQLQLWTESQSKAAQEYATDPLLCAIVDGVPDLNMSALLTYIDDELARHRYTGQKNLLQTTKLQERITRLENHQNEQHNSNIDTVLLWLHEHGFEQAISSAQYISNLDPSQRTLYLTNYPQGANGIFIHPEHLPEIQKKLANEALPDTFQYVWLTTFTSTEVHSTNGLYFPLTNDSEYDRDKARILLNTVQGTLNELLAQQHAHEQQGSLLQRLRFNIEAYQKKYPSEEQTQTAARIVQMINEHAMAQKVHADLIAGLAHVTATMVQFQKELLQAKRDAQSTTPFMEQTLRWLSNEYAHIPHLNEVLVVARRDIVQAELDLTAAEQEQQTAETALDQSRDRSRTMERLYQDTQAEQNALEMVTAPSVEISENENVTLDYLRTEYLRYLNEWRMKSEEKISAAQQMHLSNCKQEITKLEKQQQKFVVDNASNLGLSMNTISENARDKLLDELVESKHQCHDLEVRTIIAYQEYTAHKNEHISEADMILDATVAARIHEHNSQALQQQQDALKTAQEELAAAQESSSVLREKLHEVKGLKDVFDASLKDIECPPCTDIVEHLDIMLWTSQRDATLAEYRSQNTALTILRKARDALYGQYDRYRALHSDNVYLRAQNHQNPSLLLDDATLSNLLVELNNVSAAMSTDIEKHRNDQSSVVTELVTHASALTVLLEDALSQKVPQGAPLIGGMHVLRVKGNKTPFSSIGHADRMSRITGLIDEYLSEAKAFPMTSRELFAHALTTIYAKPLDFQILKMVENEKERYSFVHQVKNSGAEGVTMAMCLYMTILSVRSKPEKGRNTRDAGVLLIDNPFAKATTNKFWAALHNLADHYRVQFVFLTAVSDPETLRDFNHYIALTKKLDTVTGRRILTHANITFAKKEVPDDVVDVV